MLSRRKGIAELLSTVRILEFGGDLQHDLVLRVAGGPELLGDDTLTLDEVRGLSAAEGVERIVTFLGYIDDQHVLSELFATSDLLVVPSRSEGVPRVIDEALVAGLPVVASDLPGIRAAFAGDAQVTLVPPGDADAFAEVILQFDREKAAGSTSRPISDSLIPRPRAVDQQIRELNRLS
jgi:glycosyltransferase involved in cell wall biosynthesis